MKNIYLALAVMAGIEERNRTYCECYEMENRFWKKYFNIDSSYSINIITHG